MFPDILAMTHDFWCSEQNFEKPPFVSGFFTVNATYNNVNYKVPGAFAHVDFS